MKKWIGILAVVLGVIVTLTTGLIPIEALMGATHYRLPLPWLTRLVLAPEHNPWRINTFNLIVDTALWITGFLLVTYLIKRMKKE